jgi:hypothetical protein
MDTKPWPLQLFMPLQLFFADLHSDVPLQEFTPVQCIVAASAANETVLIPEVNSIAAAAAMAALDSLLICIFNSSIVLERSGIAAHIKDPANTLIITQLAKLMPISMRRQRAPAATKRSLLNDGFLMLAASASDRAANSKKHLMRAAL